MVALICAAGIAIPAIRRSILRTAGWALVVDEEVEPADIIVVALGADGAGVLEATDLVHSGVAKRVAVFVEPPNDPVSSEFARRRNPLRRCCRAICATTQGAWRRGHRTYPDICNGERG